jgi:hypothetical protein
LVLPACVNVSVQILFSAAAVAIMYVAPVFVHTDEGVDAYVIDKPELAAAPIVKLLALIAVVGAGVLTLIVWFAFVAVTA